MGLRRCASAICFLTRQCPRFGGLLRRLLAPHVPEPCVVRSSAPGEDSHHASFAGLHASFVNVVGLEAVLDHIKLVWASLWSDAALLYRRELGLDVRKSTMGVVVQEMELGKNRGVVFGQNPQDASQAVIEAVYGLNQGLVDGTVEPDRWLRTGKPGKILDYRPATKGEIHAARTGRCAPDRFTTGTAPIPAHDRGRGSPSV